MARLATIGFGIVAIGIVALCLEAGLASAASADSLLARSRAEAIAGHQDAAIRFAQAAIVADPARTDAYTTLGDLYARIHASESARFYYLEALEIDPQDAGAQRGLTLAESADKTRAAAAAGSLDKDEGAH